MVYFVLMNAWNTTFGRRKMPDGRIHKRVDEAAGAVATFVAADGQPDGEASE